MSHSPFFIVNPYAKAGNAKEIWEQHVLPEVLRLYPGVLWSYYQSFEHGACLALQAAEQEIDTVVAVGGDGTVNSVVNGLMQHNSIQKPTLACIPLGTGCDFVKSLNIPLDFKVALFCIRLGHKIDCDVGCVDYTNPIQGDSSKYFINVAGYGANGDVAQWVDQSRQQFGSKTTYLAAVLSVILKNMAYPTQIAFNDEEFSNMPLKALFVCNGSFCGGGMCPSPKASLSSGFLSVVAVENMNVFENIFYLSRLYSGNYQGIEKKITVKQVQSLRVTSMIEDEVYGDCDGESFLLKTAKFYLKPKALQVYSNLL